MVMNVKNTKLIFCFLLFGFLTVLSVFLGAFHTFPFCGFALDSQKLLYVGRDNAIEVYSGTEKIFEINPQTSRSYAFTVTDDTIVLSTAEFVYEIDLKGNVIKKSEDVNSKTYTDIEKSKKHFVTSDNEYFLKNNFVRYKIIDKNKNVLFADTPDEMVCICRKLMHTDMAPESIEQRRDFLYPTYSNQYQGEHLLHLIYEV